VARPRRRRGATRSRRRAPLSRRVVGDRVDASLRETTKAWTASTGRRSGSRTARSCVERAHRLAALYRYDTAGKLLATLHERRLRGARTSAASTKRTAGCTSRRPSAARSALDECRVKLDGTRARLTQAPGTHAAKYNPSFTRCVDRWSDASTPTQVSSRSRTERGADDRRERRPRAARDTRSRSRSS
jgi:hypothetical protein